LTTTVLEENTIDGSTNGKKTIGQQAWIQKQSKKNEPGEFEMTEFEMTRIVA